MKKSPIKLDLGKALLIGAAVFQAYQFGRALNVYDPQGWAVSGVNLNGLILGVIVNVIVALSSTRLPSVTGKMRLRAAWGSFVILLLLSPALVAPALYILFKPLAMIYQMKIFLSIGLSIAPDLAISLNGFIAGKSFINLSSEDNKPRSDSEAPAKPRSAKRSKPLSEMPCRYAGAGCARTFASQNAANAHARACEFKPTISDDVTNEFENMKKKKNNAIQTEPAPTDKKSKV